MTKRDLELPSAPRGRGKLRDCGVNSILTLVSVTMETCEWKPPLLTCELVVIARGKKKRKKEKRYRQKRCYAHQALLST